MAKVKSNRRVTLADALLLIDRSFQLDGALSLEEIQEADWLAMESDPALHRMEQEAESAWLRYAENRGWMEVAAEEYHDMLRGVIY